MSSGGVNAKPEDVKRLAAALQRYQKQVEEAGKAFQSALDGAQWHDAQKERFAGKYRDFQKGVNSFVSNDSKPMMKYLNDYARRLEEVRSMRM